jgi:hypothetical protein
MAERETAILEIKPKKINKTGNVGSNITLRGVSVTILAVKKQELLHILSVSVALVVQRAMRMRPIVVCGLPGSAVLLNFIS